MSYCVAEVFKTCRNPGTIDSILFVFYINICPKPHIFVSFQKKKIKYKFTPGFI